MSKIIKPTAPNPPWPDGVADENTRRVLLPLVQTHITRNGDTDERFITMRDLRREIGPQLTDLGVITEGRGVTKADVMTIVSDVGYTRSKLQADLSGGVQRIVAGVGSDGRLVVDSATGHVVMMHKDVVYDGYSSIADALNIRLPAIALTPAGIAMGYNDTDGQWVNSVAIEASTGNAWFSGTVNALSGNFAEGITIGGTGITLGQLAVGNYSAEDLKTDLAAGVESVLAGFGTDYRMTVDAAGVVFGHKDIVYNGTLGTPAPGVSAVAITATGIGMGYNDPVTGVWTNAVAISSTGDVTILGTLKAGAIIEAGVTVNGVPMGTVAANATQALADAQIALDGAQDAIDAAALAQADAQAAIDALPDKLSGSSANILTGTIQPQNTGGVKVGSITWNSTTGVLTGGSGIAITEAGIIGAKNGVSQFAIDTAGNATFAGALSGATGTFSGSLSAASGTFTGALSSATGTFTGSLSSVNGTFTGQLVAATGTFAGNVVTGGNLNVGGDAFFTGNTLSANQLFFAGAVYTFDCSAIANATSETLSNRIRCGLLGQVGTVGSFRDVGVAGYAPAAGRGIGVVGDGSIYGGAFYSATGIGLAASTTSGTALVVTGPSQFDGNINATGNVTAYGSSDRSLKENIEVISDALSKLQQIRGVSFDWVESFHKDNPGFPAHDVGVIAQEVREVLPEVVAEKTDGTLGVRYEKLIPLLIEAIKELTEKVERLEAR